MARYTVNITRTIEYMMVVRGKDEEEATTKAEQALEESGHDVDSLYKIKRLEFEEVSDDWNIESIDED